MDIQEFIKRNNLQLKTQQDIVEKFDNIHKSASIFDFRSEVLIHFLSYESAKSYLKQEYVKKIEEGTEVWAGTPSLEQCAQDFLDYMTFAWGKAEDERGISANRSIQKLGTWLWLMNRDDLRKIIEDNNLFNPYGAPALIEVCNKMGIVVPDSLIEFSKQKC